MDLKVTLKFFADAFHGGIAKANQGLGRFKQAVTGLKKTFSFLGGALLLGGIGAALGGIGRRMDEIRASGDFITISEEDLNRLEGARENIRMMRDSMLDVAAIGLSKVLGLFTGDTGESTAAHTADANKQKDLHRIRMETDAIRAKQTEGLNDDIKVLELKKFQADQAAALGKTEIERAMALKDSVDLEQQIRDLKLKQLHAANKIVEAERVARREDEARILAIQTADSEGNPEYGKAMKDRAAALRSAALDPSARRAFMHGERDKEREQERIDKLVSRYNRKTAAGKNTTAAERLAFESVQANNAAESALNDIRDSSEEIAKNTAGLIKNISLGH